MVPLLCITSPDNVIYFPIKASKLNRLCPCVAHLRHMQCSPSIPSKDKLWSRLRSRTFSLKSTLTEYTWSHGVELTRPSEGLSNVGKLSTFVHAGMTQV
uniref:Uncharacterized protein n=1 Tax=Anguilla anguilla TaxID=7936 RepID=A0A0E9X5B1_ANGAN